MFPAVSDGWVWPPTPPQSDLPYIPRKKKRKRRIPQSVLDEWRGFSRPASSLGEEGDLHHANEISDIDSAQGEIPDDEIPDDVRFLGLDDEN